MTVNTTIASADVDDGDEGQNPTTTTTIDRRRLRRTLSSDAECSANNTTWSQSESRGEFDTQAERTETGIGAQKEIDNGRKADKQKGRTMKQTKQIKIEIEQQIRTKQQAIQSDRIY